jgi:hypothetical protein
MGKGVPVISSIPESPTKMCGWLINRARWVAFLLVATFTYVIPASAQSADTWKSVAIIGGSTAAGAYVGHKIAGTKGTYIGAAVGASAGYAIDRRRRQNEANNGDYAYDGSGDYGAYPSNEYPNSGDGGYYGDQYNKYPYASDDQNSNRYSTRSQIPRR